MTTTPHGDVPTTETVTVPDVNHPVEAALPKRRREGNDPDGQRPATMRTSIPLCPPAARPPYKLPQDCFETAGTLPKMFEAAQDYIYSDRDSHNWSLDKIRTVAWECVRFEIEQRTRFKIQLSHALQMMQLRDIAQDSATEITKVADGLQSQLQEVRMKLKESHNKAKREMDALRGQLDRLLNETELAAWI